tara:strand:- start:92 stop:451 length:360 start_codon:yes stop_codon:yes gene_type:complete
MNLNIADFHKELNRLSKNENAVRDDQGGIILSEATDVLNKLITMLFNDIERSKNNVNTLLETHEYLQNGSRENFPRLTDFLDKNGSSIQKDYIQRNCEFRRTNESILFELMLMMKGDEQ